MKSIRSTNKGRGLNTMQKTVIIMMSWLLIFPFNVFSVSLPPTQDPDPEETPDSIHGIEAEPPQTDGTGALPPINDRVKFVPDDTIPSAGQIASTADSLFRTDEEWVEREIAFNPDPVRAVWMSALFPGLGQVYNRRYWKLPIIVGGYLGLGYATSWNNGMLKDYTRAYADITDNDPSTNSYMDFFPSTTNEEDLDKTWLTNLLQSRKNYFRRNRDLCIICMVGVYFLAMIDAYVDASLSHFDITPDLSMDVYPAMIQDGRNRFPSVGLQWAINF